MPRLEGIAILTGAKLRVAGAMWELLARELRMLSGVPVEHASFEDPASMAEAVTALEPGIGAIVCPGDFGGSDLLQRSAAAAAGHRPLIWVELAAALDPRPDYLDPVRIPSIRGRGLEAFAWAARSLLARAAWPHATVRYGDHPEQIGDVRVPAAGTGPAPACVLIHGGGWRERWERDLMDGLAVDLSARGYATWNVEFRRVGPSGGGWPGSLADVIRALETLPALATDYPIDATRVAVIGHSAGAQLAALAASRTLGGRAAPASPRTVWPSVVVSLAGSLDLFLSGARGSDELSTIAYMGSRPDESEAEYRAASPLERLPLGCPQIVAWGLRDRPDVVDRNLGYAARAAELGDAVITHQFPDADHFTVLDAESQEWKTVAGSLEHVFSSARMHDRADPANRVGIRRVEPEHQLIDSEGGKSLE
jgi:acetyl esterase/lipase